eukprot:11026606-Ditylum_brightwellii.AAC.1
MLQRNGIKDAPTTSRNPQANSVCKSLHLMVANILRATTNGQANNMQQAVNAVDDALVTAMHATRCSVSRSLGLSPGNLVFRRDMFMDLPIVVDLLTIRDKRQALIDKNVRQQNLRWREFDYAAGQE